ncbi:MAG: hypothetical protein WKF96_07470 [Solirubrobacteraceae bacterium]
MARKARKRWAYHHRIIAVCPPTAEPGLIATTLTDWLGLVSTLIGPLVGFVGGLWLYRKRQRDDEARRTKEQFEVLYLQLRAELEANRRIAVRSLKTIESVLKQKELGPNEAIHDESLYIAPLFAQSWAALARTDAHRVIPSATLDQLFARYAAVARANWLIERVQRFQFRRPILDQIRATLLEVDPPEEPFDLEALKQFLAPESR